MENLVYESQQLSGVGDPPIAIGPGARGVGPSAGARRRALGTAFAVGLGVAVLAGAPASAVAADDCPNAAVREQQASTHLPNCMAYEMVSPVEAAGTAAERTQYVTADGSSALFTAVNGFDDALGSMSGYYRSVRGADGWQTSSIGPAYTNRLPSGSNEIPRMAGASEDLSKVIFEAVYPFHPQDQGKDRMRMTRSVDVYRREADGTMTWLTPSVTLPDTTTSGAFYITASKDQSRVLVTAYKRMAADVPDESVYHLYLHVDGLPPQLVTRGVDGQPMDAALPGNTQQVTWTSMSDDGSRVVFQTGSSTNPQIFLRDHADDPARGRTIELTPGTRGRRCEFPTLVDLSRDGRTVQFTCTNQLTDEPLTGYSGLYRLNLDTNQLDLIEPTVPPAPDVFETDEALVPEDQNGTWDVYARVDGKPRLISSGTHSKASWLASVSADQRSIFFTTMESLAPQDVDGDVQSLYVARVDGGFLAPETTAECVRECQGPGMPAPVVPTVASVSFVGSGNVLDPQTKQTASPLGKLSTAKAKSVKGTAAAVSVKLPSGGRVGVTGSGLRAVSRTVTKAGSVRLTVRLSQRARTTLARKGRVAIRATVRFVPSSGKAQSQRVKLTFTRKAKAKSKQGASRTGAVRAIANGKGGR